jgi:hypothetical protein
MDSKELLEKLFEEQKKTNVLLTQLIEIMTTSIDMAMGGDTLNKDFLDNEVRQDFITG